MARGTDGARAEGPWNPVSVRRICRRFPARDRTRQEFASRGTISAGCDIRDAAGPEPPAQGNGQLLSAPRRGPSARRSPSPRRLLERDFACWHYARCAASPAPCQLAGTASAAPARAGLGADQWHLAEGRIPEWVTTPGSGTWDCVIMADEPPGGVPWQGRYVYGPLTIRPRGPRAGLTKGQRTSCGAVITQGAQFPGTGVRGLGARGQRPRRLSWHVGPWGPWSLAG